MPPRVLGLATPELLIWARETAGLTVELVARKLRVNPEHLYDWEAGRGHPSLSQLRRLAEIYRRPLAVFYLSEKPEGWKTLQDFRRVSGPTVPTTSPALAFEIRRARDRRDWAIELLEQLEEPPPQFEGALTLGEEAESAASKLRKTIGISFDQQTEWRKAYEAFKGWRLTIEAAGILTFQATEITVSEARGFSLGEVPLPVIVTNIKDSPRARIFTLLHELVHVMLNEAGICDFHDESGSDDRQTRVERFCNRVAGAALFPLTELRNSEVVRGHPPNEPVWTDVELDELSKRFGGSPEAALVRLLTLGMTTNQFYWKRHELFSEEYKKSRQKTGGFALPHVVAISSAGPSFTKLVVQALSREKITVSDLSDYLQIRTKHFKEVQQEMASLVR